MLLGVVKADFADLCQFPTEAGEMVEMREVAEWEQTAECSGDWGPEGTLTSAGIVN